MPEMPRWLRYQIEVKPTDENTSEVEALLAQAEAIKDNADEVLALFACPEVETAEAAFA